MNTLNLTLKSGGTRSKEARLRRLWDTATTTSLRSRPALLHRQSHLVQLRERIRLACQRSSLLLMRDWLATSRVNGTFQTPLGLLAWYILTVTPRRKSYLPPSILRSLAIFVRRVPTLRITITKWRAKSTMRTQSSQNRKQNAVSTTSSRKSRRRRSSLRSSSQTRSRPRKRHLRFSNSSRSSRTSRTSSTSRCRWSRETKSRRLR